MVDAASPKRIALVAHYSESNYGNHLVNYAAKRVLEGGGAKVDVIAFTGGRVTLMVDKIARLPLKVMRLLWGGVLWDRVIGRLRHRAVDTRNMPGGAAIERARRQRFLAFADAHLSPSHVAVADRRSLLDRYDMFVVGSDQVWNYDYELGRWLFLDFARPERIATLAPSVGHASIPLEWRRTYGRWLGRFREIGAREIDWASSLPTLTTRITRLIDPTLAIDREHWNRLARRPETDGGVLIYELGAISNEHAEKVQQIASKHKLSITTLSPNAQGEAWASDAADFLGRIASADCVVTDSYHGAIFAFLFDRPVLIARRSGFAGSMNSRIDALIENFHLEDRLIENVDLDDALQHDYRHGYESLEVLRAEFRAYVRRNILDDHA